MDDLNKEQVNKNTVSLCISGWLPGHDPLSSAKVGITQAQGTALSQWQVNLELTREEKDGTLIPGNAF